MTTSDLDQSFGTVQSESLTITSLSNERPRPIFWHCTVGESNYYKLEEDGIHPNSLAPKTGTLHSRFLEGSSVPSLADPMERGNATNGHECLRLQICQELSTFIQCN